MRIPIAADAMLAEAIAGDRPIFVPDVRSSARYANTGDGTRMVVPIRSGGALLCLLDLASDRVLHLTRQDLPGLQVAVDQLGVALWNAELYEAALVARENAERADRLKTRLLANVSHELQTPLNVILGYTEGALATPNAYDHALPKPLRRDLTHVYNSGEHLLRLINDLLDISRADIGELELFPEPIATGPFLREVFEHLSAGIGGGEGVIWDLELPDRLPMIEADPLRLRQIMLNLLQNARNYTHRGRIVLGAEVEPAWLHLWVSDTGSGIPADLLDSIFEPFTRGDQPDRQVDGIGLGLSIVRRLVALHRGLLTVESQIGCGSTFHVYLPWPELDHQASATTELESGEPILLLLSARDEMPEEIALLAKRQGLTVRSFSGREQLDDLLKETRPVALAWDVRHVDLADWVAFDQVRRHPKVCRVPLIVYGDVGEGGPRAGLAGIALKPLRERTVIDLLRALQPEAQSGPVLIVDDDAGARLFYQGLVTKALPDREVVTAEGGAVALTALQSDLPCLVILDLTMPEVDGFAVLEHLRTDPCTRHVPVLVISGRVLSEEDLQRLDYRRVTLQSKEILTDEEVVAAVKHTLSGADALPQPTGMLAKRAAAYLQRHYARALTRQEIAEALGVHRDYLSRVFHQELGISPWDYLNRYRINRAKGLLQATDLPITEVAAKVGFEDSAYFSRVFRREVGQSPRAYRNGGA